MADQMFPDCQFTRASAYVLTYGTIIAMVRDSPTVELVDLLGGLYVASSKRLSKYWKTSRGFGRLVTRQAVLRDPISAYQKGSLPATIQRAQLEVRKGFVPLSPDLIKVLMTAREIAASATKIGRRRKPVLAPEHFLLAIAGCTEFDAGLRLRESGLHVDRLKEAVRKLKPQPA